MFPCKGTDYKTDEYGSLLWNSLAQLLRIISIKAPYLVVCQNSKLISSSLHSIAEVYSQFYFPILKSAMAIMKCQVMQYHAQRLQAPWMYCFSSCIGRQWELYIGTLLEGIWPR